MCTPWDICTVMVLTALVLTFVLVQTAGRYGLLWPQQAACNAVLCIAAVSTFQLDTGLA